MSNVEALCQDWLDAKKAEEGARDQRLAIEAQLTEALDAPEEGSKTHKLENYKVTMTQPIYRKVDADVWKRVQDRVPSEMAPIKTKTEADAAGCKWMAKNEPSLWASISEAFETKPGKVSIKVEQK